MSSQHKESLIAEEAFIIQHSGEIPEVTYHESLYHLTEDPDGPGLTINTEDVLSLKHAVVKRYRAIILRDLDPGNRDKGTYRGLARCLANWQRLVKFCATEKMDSRVIQNEAATALQEFFNNEIDDVLNNNRSSCINCSAKEIETLVNFLGLSVADLPVGWQTTVEAIENF